MFSDIETIFWDWNGTLLDDIDICIESMNLLLKEHQKELIGRDQYRSIFDFPVINYYKKLGFKLTNGHFEELSVSFIRNYSDLQKKAKLHPYAVNILNKIKRQNIPQVILSAMESESLGKSLQHHDIRDLFHKVLGLDNIYAESKTHLAENFLKAEKLDPKKCLLIGDTLHDYEVACEIGSRCILIADGHQDYGRLVKTGVPVFKSLEELLHRIY